MSLTKQLNHLRLTHLENTLMSIAVLYYKYVNLTMPLIKSKAT